MSRTRTITLTLGSLAAGAVLATGVTGLAMADDQSGSAGSSQSSPAASGQATDPSAPMLGDRGPRGGHGPGMPGGMHGRMGGPLGEPLHGELVVKADDGSISTVRTIHGTVTAASADSITVKAEDGYTATFAIDADTEVRAGLPERGSDPSASTDTMADVTVGDVAHVDGTVSGSTATATRVFAMSADEAAQMEAQRSQMDAQHGQSGTPTSQAG